MGELNHTVTLRNRANGDEGSGSAGSLQLSDGALCGGGRWKLKG